MGGPTVSPPLHQDTGCAGRVARLDLNESAYPPLPAVAAVLHSAAVEAHRYPEFLPDGTRACIARYLGVPDEQVTVGTGATGVALLALLAAVRRDAAQGSRSPAIVTAVPTFDGYPILADMLGMRIDPVPLTVSGDVDLERMLAAMTADTAAAVLCSPHNPTGRVVGESALHEFLDAVPHDVMVLLDQAYTEFDTAPPDLRRILRTRTNVLVLRTFSKAYGLAALRVGYGVGHRDVVEQVRRYEVPFAVSPAAAAAVPVALAAEHQLAQRVADTRAERARMADLLADVGCSTLPSEGNFLYLPGRDGIAIGRLLRACGIVTKECRGHGLRITVGDRACTDEVLAALRNAALRV